MKFIKTIQKFFFKVTGNAEIELIPVVAEKKDDYGSFDRDKREINNCTGSIARCLNINLKCSQAAMANGFLLSFIGSALCFLIKINTAAKYYNSLINQYENDSVNNTGYSCTKWQPFIMDIDYKEQVLDIHATLRASIQNDAPEWCEHLLKEASDQSDYMKHIMILGAFIGVAYLMSLPTLATMDVYEKKDASYVPITEYPSRKLSL